MKKVTKTIFNYWKRISDYKAAYRYSNPLYKVSERTYQRIRSVDTYEEYEKKYCKKAKSFSVNSGEKTVNPIQKTYVNPIEIAILIASITW